MPFSWPFSYGPLRWISINWPIAQNFNFEVSTPLIGPSTPSTIFPPPSPSPPAGVEDVFEAAANLGFTPKEAQSNRYRALIFDTKVVRSISTVSGVFWVGNWFMRSINTFAWFNALLYQFTLEGMVGWHTVPLYLFVLGCSGIIQPSLRNILILPISQMLSLYLVPSPRINHAIDRGRDHLDILVGRNWGQPLLRPF